MLRRITYQQANVVINHLHRPLAAGHVIIEEKQFLFAMSDKGQIVVDQFKVLSDIGVLYSSFNFMVHFIADYLTLQIAIDLKGSRFGLPKTPHFLEPNYLTSAQN